MIGRAVGNYKVIDQLGAGGMGVVYRAEDVRLRRTVALKFLSATALADEDSKARFLHEAQAAASLDHPNICGIYEIGEAEGRLFMAMPLLEGTSLDKKVAEGPRPLPEVLEIATQTAEALEEAHSKQIVHRDIKPANIMVSERARGRLHCVLMDFGLARLSQATRLTREGSQLGTAAYMSPEQIQGSAVDRRSDIWSLGVVLYEIVVGRLPFVAHYEQALFYGILHEQPEPITALRTGVPMELERIVGKCLAKAPNERYQTCTDLLVDLAALKKSLETASAHSVARPPASAAAGSSFARASLSPASQALGRRRFSLPQVAAISLLLAGLAGGLVWWWKGPAPEAAPATEYTLKRVTWDGALSGFPALSPDGRLLAYASDRAGNGDLDIWVQQVEGGSLIRVTDSPADELYPSFSPDGTRIVFFRWGEGVYVVPALGGDPYLVAKDAAKPVFGPDGDTVAFFREGRLYQSPVSMGEPKRLMASLEDVGPPLWTPDGSQIIAYGRRQGEPPDLWAVPASDDSPPRKLGAGEVFRRAGHYLPYPETWSWSGTDVLLGSDGELYRVPLDPRTWTITGPPNRLTFGSGTEALPSGSVDGKIAFMEIRQRGDIWSLKLHATTGAAVGEPERLTQTESNDTAGDIAPASDRLVYISNRWGRRDIWIKDLVTGKESNLTNDSANQQFPILSPDGEQIAYFVEEESKPAIYLRPFAGGIGRRLCADCGTPRSWAGGTPWLLFDRGKTSGIHVLNVETGSTAEILGEQGYGLDSSRVSSDGKWVVFRAETEGAEVSIQIAPFRGGERVPHGEWITVTSHASDQQPAWGIRGDIVYFASSRLGSHDLWMQRLNPSTKQPVGDPQVVKRFPLVRYSLQLISFDGRRLAVSRDRLVFPMSEVSGNVWLMEPKTPASEP